MTKVVNIADLVKKPLLTIVVDGKKHDLVPASVETYIQNLTDIEALPLNATPRQEIELAVKLIARAFPSLKEEQIRSWSLDQLQSLQEIARQANGEVASTEDPAEAAPGNGDPETK